MGYCIDDICHNAGPICGAGSPYHCRADGGPPADHYCDDPGCETCEPWDADFDDPSGRSGEGGPSSPVGPPKNETEDNDG